MKNAAQPKMGGSLLMRSLDNGATWQGIATGSIVPLTVAPSPAGPATLLVGARDGIYKTTDGGATWRKTWAPASIRIIAIDPANPLLIYAIGDSPAIFLGSADGGETWHNLTAPLTQFYDFFDLLYYASPLWVDPNGSGTVVLGFAVSRDHGETWRQMTAIMPNPSGGAFIVPVPGAPGALYAASSFGAQGEIYFSSDWGATWNPRVNPDFFNVEDLLVDPDQNTTLYAVSSGYLYISNNGGYVWNKTALTARNSAAVLGKSCAGGTLLAVGYQVVGISNDSGATSQSLPIPDVTMLATGSGCAAYAVRSVEPDVFVAKIAPDGEVLWATFLGGSGSDGATAIAIDGAGNVYVTGVTSSPDFPATRPLVGVAGSQNVFVAKFDPAGNRIWSEVIGGEISDSVSAMAVDQTGIVYLSGQTFSTKFPTTSGVFQPASPGPNAGFVVKLAADGTMLVSSYLPNVDVGQIYPQEGPSVTIGVVAEAGGSMLIGGHGATLSRILADGSAISPVFTAPGQIFAMHADGRGNVYVAGTTTPAGSVSAACKVQNQFGISYTLPAGDVFVVKLEAGTLAQSYSARLSGDCVSAPGAIDVGPSGEAVLGVWSWDKFVQQHPLERKLPQCGGARYSTVSRLSADGANLLFSSYVDTCGSVPPPAASGIEGAVFAAVSAPGSVHAAVIRLTADERPVASY